MENRLKGHDVLELKARLMDRIVDTPQILYMESFLKSIARKSYGGYSTVKLTEQDTGESLNLTAGAAWCLSEYNCLHQGESYLIGAQMNLLIRLAAADIPDDLAFEEQMMPSKFGFLVFEEPWEHYDVRGQRLLTRVITWQPMEDQHGSPGVQIAQYSAFSDNDEITQRLKRESDPKQYAKYVKELGDVQVQHLMPTQYGQTLGGGVGRDWSDDQIRAAVDPLKAVMALWMLMQQKVTETVVPSMSPRSEHRWQKKSVKPAVNVINLRRRRIVSQTAEEHEAGHRDWSGRWMVKGHWRNQPHGPGRQERHWVYIHPFLKGPDDKPIIDRRPRVYKLSR